MKEQKLINIISAQFQNVQNNNLAVSHSSSHRMVQVYRVTATKMHDHSYPLKASKGHKHFRILIIINTHPAADTQPEKHSKKICICFSCDVSNTWRRAQGSLRVNIQVCESVNFSGKKLKYIQWVCLNMASSIQYTVQIPST